MNINCHKCNKEYEIDESKIPSTGAQVKCSQCETMIDIDFPSQTTSDWYITTDEENIYEATKEEVIEWILENRLIRSHKVSKDKSNWIKLEDIPDFLKVIEEKEENEKIEDEPTIQNKDTNPKEIIPSYKKIDYTDYDDSIIEPVEDFKPKKRHFFIWLVILVLMAGGIFALIKPKLVKQIFTKINPTSSISSEQSFNRAMTLFNSFDSEKRNEVISLFDKSLKENPKYQPALINKVLFISYNLYFDKLDLNFRKNLSKKLNKLSDEDKKNNIIKKIISKNNKELLRIQKDIDRLGSLLSASLKEKLNSLTETKNHNLIITKALLSYLDSNKNDLKKLLLDAKTLKEHDSKTVFIKLLYFKMDNHKSYISNLDDSTTRFANSIPLNFLNAFELLSQDKYNESKYIFKAIKGLSSKNKIATDYIIFLNTIIKIEKTFLNKKEEKKVVEEDNKEANKKEDNSINPKKEETKNELKKETKKVVKKPVKLSAERATDIGWNMIDSNRLSAAIKKFRYAISKNSNYSLAYQGLGEAYRIKGDKQKAIKYFKIFLAKDPNNSEAKLVKKQIQKLQKSDK